MADQLPQKTEKPWGYELLWALTPRYAGKVLFVRQGQRLSFQFHRSKDESMYVYQGKVRLETARPGGPRQTRLFEAGQSVHLPPGTRHRIEAIEDTYLLEVSTPELEDVVRLEDDYGRADRG